jgi:uncharacterized Zn ribbon protein
MKGEIKSQNGSAGVTDIQGESFRDQDSLSLVKDLQSTRANIVRLGNIRRRNRLG